MMNSRRGGWGVINIYFTGIPDILKLCILDQVYERGKRNGAPLKSDGKTTLSYFIPFRCPPFLLDSDMRIFCELRLRLKREAGALKCFAGRRSRRNAGGEMQEEEEGKYMRRRNTEGGAGEMQKMMRRNTGGGEIKEEKKYRRR